MSILRIILLVIFVVACSQHKSIYKEVCRYSYGRNFNEYAQLNEVVCRRDFELICVENNITLDAEVITGIISKAKFILQKHVQAVRTNEVLSEIERYPVIEVVSVEYNWLKNGEIVDWNSKECLAFYGGTENTAAFHFRNKQWEYFQNSMGVLDS